MLKRLFAGIRSLFRKKKPRLYTRQYVEDAPENIQDNIVYLENHLGYPWQASMVCPCGCKHILHMNLLSEYHPYWKFTIHKDNSVTLYPSVHRMVGCKSHFFLRKGTIQWCAQ